jgi:hypothetical protein
LIRADLETSKIDFRLLASETRPTERKGKTERERKSKEKSVKKNESGGKRRG